MFRNNQTTRNIVVLLMALVVVLCGSLQAATLDVPGSYGTIQAAIDAASYGDTVEVAEGTYYECIILKDGVAVISADGPLVTTIDGGAAGPGVRSIDCGPDTVLEGFTITNGWAATSGGGMYNKNSSPTVTNCTFSGNTASDYGGGMFNENSSPTVSDCTFSGNSVNGTYGSGGGMYNNSASSPTVTNCTFSENSASHWGGGMSNVDSSPTVANCTFRGNSAGEDGGGMSNYNYNSGSPTVTNCTFIGNTATINGGGMYNRFSSDSTVKSCTFTGNSASIGGGMANHQSDSTVSDCTFSGNTANINGSGGGMHNFGSSPTVTNCTFTDNSAPAGGGMSNVSSSSPTVTNCTFSGNTASDYGGGGMRNIAFSSPTVTNCTFSGNTANESGGGMYNYGTCSPIITNCIMWGNTAPTGSQIYSDEGSSPTITYSDVQGGWSGTGNINADPLFVGGVHLLPGSPCIDAGDNTALPGSVTTDLDGNARFVDHPGTADTGNGTPPIVDMGAYEYKPFIYVDADASTGGDGTTWASAYKYLKDALDPELVVGHEVWVAAGTYRPDPGGLADPREATFQLVSGVAIYGGFPSGGGVWDDRNPNAYETILSGDLNGDDSGFTNNDENSYHVVTGSGTDETAVLDGFTITAGNAYGNFQWFDARLCGGGMYNYSCSPTVTDCTYTGNSAILGGGMCNYHGSPTVTDCTFSGNSANSHGGGMCNITESNPTVNNCIFSGNAAGDSGGGMHNYTDSSPILTNCTFNTNWAHSGGGLCNYHNSSPTLTNCRFNTNSACGVNANGGGMYNRYFSDPTMTNSIFRGNSANDAGGAMFTWDSCIPTLSNCTFSQNSAVNGKALACDDPQGGRPPSTLEVTNCILWDGGGEIWNNDNSTITINYSDVEGGYGGTGNINADPLFAASLHLLPGSPCIDAGDNTAVPTGVTTDLDGNPRFKDDPETADTGNGTAPIVDMGTYEFPQTQTGSNVTVLPLDTSTWTQPVTMTFEEVTEPGVTSLTTSSSGPEPPAGFMPGDPETYYDLSTTATYDGDIEVSIDYSGTSFVCSEEHLGLYHYGGDEWIDVTTWVDTQNKAIGGIVSSLSPLAIFEPENQRPVIGAISAPPEPVQVNTTVEASASFSDPDIGDTHTAEWDWGDGSTSPGTVEPGTVSGMHTYITPGVYTVKLTLTDALGASDEAVFQYVVVYDPSAGFVTGGGWIYSPAGALLDSTAEGKATFGFVAKYKKGTNVPTGNTEFRFRDGGFSFKSSSYEWLVVAGTKAMFKGEGSIDGMVGSFKFMLTGVDDTEDKFRIKISEPASDDPIYDNKRGEGDEAEPTVIGGGSIVIHQQ